VIGICIRRNNIALRIVLAKEWTFGGVHHQPPKYGSTVVAGGHHDWTERRLGFDRTEAKGEFPEKSNFQHDLLFLRSKNAT
jgi:hypothetical protein